MEKVEHDAEKVTFTDTLIQITEQLSESETKQFKFLCSDKIASGILEKMNATDLMNSLFESRIISAKNIDFLTECLILIGRMDMVNKLGCEPAHIEKLCNNLKKYNSTRLDRFRILLFQLAENITKEEVKKIKLYLGEKVTFPKGKMEGNQSGFDLIDYLIKVNFVHSDKVNDLVDLAKKLNRGDLEEKIKIYSDGQKESCGKKKNIQKESCSMVKEVIEESSDLKSDIQKESCGMMKEPVCFDFPSEVHIHQQLGILTLSSGIMEESSDLKSDIQIESCGMMKGIMEESSDLKSESMDCQESPKFISPLEEPLSRGELKSVSQVIPPELVMDLEKYKMTSPIRGICLIINNEYFQTLPQRRGTNIDKADLIKTFRRLQFKIIEADNLTKVQMEEKLMEVAAMDHNKYGCFVCYILSHGGESVVFGTDGKQLSHKLLTMPFKQGLSGKPKLFFIQACQGRNAQQGTESIEIDDWETDGAAATLIPDEEDLFIACSNVTGFTSFRSKSRGSWFIRILCKVLSENATSLDLGAMILMVNNCLSREIGKKNTLKKKLFF